MAALSTDSQFLKQALRGNTVFSGLSAAAMIFGSGVIARFMGLSVPGALVIIGAILVGHGLILWMGSNQNPISPTLAWYAILGDIGWVVGSIVILVLDPWSFSVGGKWIIAILADIVAVFGILQYVGLRRLQR